MSEHHRIVGEARGERLGDRVGVRVRIRLSGCPSQHWSRDFSARLANELVAHPPVGHLRLNNIVQGDQLVLEGVEAREMQTLAVALRRAMDATNHACPDDERSARPAEREADAIAQAIAAGADATMPGAGGQDAWTMSRVSPNARAGAGASIDG